MNHLPSGCAQQHVSEELNRIGHTTRHPYEVVEMNYMEYQSW